MLTPSPGLRSRAAYVWGGCRSVRRMCLVRSSPEPLATSPLVRTQAISRSTHWTPWLECHTIILPTLLNFCPGWRSIPAFLCSSGFTPSLHLHGLTSEFGSCFLNGTLLESSPWHVGCSLTGCDLERRSIPDKGKPAVRRGRKAADQATGLTAGLPKEGRPRAPRERGGLPQRGGRQCSGEPVLLSVTPSFVAPFRKAPRDPVA